MRFRIEDFCWGVRIIRIRNRVYATLGGFHFIFHVLFFDSPLSGHYAYILMILALHWGHLLDVLFGKTFIGPEQEHGTKVWRHPMRQETAEDPALVILLI